MRQIVAKCAKMRQNMAKHGKTWQNAPKCAKIRQNMAKPHGVEITQLNFGILKMHKREDWGHIRKITRIVKVKKKCSKKKLQPQLLRKVCHIIAKAIAAEMSRKTERKWFVSSSSFPTPSHS